MKVKRQILVLFLTMLVEIPILSAQSKKEQKKQKAEVVGKIVTSKVYKINVGTCILPCKAPILLNESDYSIEIKNDSIFSDLLYLGQADIPYRRGAELYFQAPLKKYTVDIDKKKISFDAPIKMVGRRIVKIKLHPQVTVELAVEIAGE